MRETEGLTRAKYWQTKVKNKEDVARYYRLYYPEYPDILVNSIAAKVEEVITKANRGQQLNDEERRLFEHKADFVASWDPREDIQQQMLEGKIALATKRLEALLEDEEEKK